MEYAFKWVRILYIASAFVTDASSKPSRSLAKIATIVAIATLSSKVTGAARQMATAAVFGVGPAVGAYGFAYTIPSFFLILLGRINGSFHSAIVGVLAKKERSDVKPVIETIATLLVGLLLVVSIGLIVFAEPILRLTASGLFISPKEALRQGIDPAAYTITQQTRLIAITQLRIMAPITLVLGLIGIGFGPEQIQYGVAKIFTADQLRYRSSGWFCGLRARSQAARYSRSTSLPKSIESQNSLPVKLDNGLFLSLLHR